MTEKGRTLGIMEEPPHDWLTMLLGGLGISFAPYEFMGGLLLSMAVASLMARHRRDKRKVWASVLTAALFATFAAIFWDWSGSDFAPVQLVMAAAGVLGRPAATILVALQDRLEARSIEIADKAIDHVLPDRDPPQDHAGGRHDV